MSFNYESCYRRRPTIPWNQNLAINPGDQWQLLYKLLYIFRLVFLQTFVKIPIPRAGSVLYIVQWTCSPRFQIPPAIHSSPIATSFVECTVYKD